MYIHAYHIISYHIISYHISLHYSALHYITLMHPSNHPSSQPPMHTYIHTHIHTYIHTIALHCIACMDEGYNPDYQGVRRPSQSANIGLDGAGTAIWKSLCSSRSRSILNVNGSWQMKSLCEGALGAQKFGFSTAHDAVEWSLEHGISTI